MSTGRGEGVGSSSTGGRLPDVQVDLLEFVLQSTAPALESDVDVVLLSKMAG